MALDAYRNEFLRIPVEISGLPLAYQASVGTVMMKMCPQTRRKGGLEGKILTAQVGLTF
jgi:hypothetical protein